MEALNTLRPVFDAYDRGYNFGEQGLYYDIKHNPVNHFKAFYQLSRLFVHLAIFSAKTSWEFDGLMLSINWTTGAELSTLTQKPSSRKKKRFDRQTRYTARFTVEYEATSYIANLTRRNHQEISGRCVAVDPGRRDTLYFVHENSTPEQPVKFRYTKQQQDKTWKIKKYRRILQDLKAQDPDVVQAEQALSQLYNMRYSLS
ncbi:uncharacterized protein RHIMIDRAFT_294333 [Rhizopus microsporus ATCC 52813]|uniref:Uncharacterized protein n=1 Tax=Rhizopus microsporus ATCC 52813 TaxID=1340429 RepID=A0A2G4SL47_RHIZD|nr:uncharacterized protein RHIMIDRAFT_294333 [Rhizopus microsporus ATCC 52813]PHZ09484.1 hypothetical protein RHIMIDRAFT_294333 [Rhizopus microsporus ATCC 52813]